MNAFIGTWVANVDKSRRHANHQFQSATLTFAMDGDAVSMTHAGVNMAGKHESGTSVLQGDGQEHAIPQAPGVVVVTKRIGSRVLETEGRKGGQVVGRGTYAVSDKGQTLRATAAGVNAAGAAFEQVIVFERG